MLAFVGVGDDGGPEDLAGRLHPQPSALDVAQPLGALDEHVPERGRTSGLGVEDLTGEGAGTRARLDDDVGVGLAHVPPPVVESACQYGSEQGSHLGAGQEVTAPTGATARAVEPVLRVIEREVDDLVERDRPEAPRPLGDDLGYRTNDATSPRWAKNCG